MNLRSECSQLRSDGLHCVYNQWICWGSTVVLSRDQTSQTPLLAKRGFPISLSGCWLKLLPRVCSRFKYESLNQVHLCSTVPCPSNPARMSDGLEGTVSSPFFCFCFWKKHYERIRNKANFESATEASTNSTFHLSVAVQIAVINGILTRESNGYITESNGHIICNDSWKQIIFKRETEVMQKNESLVSFSLSFPKCLHHFLCFLWCLR